MEKPIKSNGDKNNKKEQIKKDKKLNRELEEAKKEKDDKNKSSEAKEEKIKVEKLNFDKEDENIFEDKAKFTESPVISTTASQQFPQATPIPQETPTPNNLENMAGNAPATQTPNETPQPRGEYSPRTVNSPQYSASRDISQSIEELRRTGAFIDAGRTTASREMRSLPATGPAAEWNRETGEEYKFERPSAVRSEITSAAGFRDSRKLSEITAKRYYES